LITQHNEPLAEKLIWSCFLLNRLKGNSEDFYWNKPQEPIKLILQKLKVQFVFFEPHFG